jgi:hypothetical protein
MLRQIRCSFSSEPGGTITFMVRAFDGIGDQVAVDADAGQMNRVLRMDYGRCECGCGKKLLLGHRYN